MSTQYENKIWCNWETQIEVIRNNILQLCATQEINTKVWEIIKNNEAIYKPNVFYTFISQGYQNILIMGIRRQIKINKDSVSLLGLLTDINRNRNILENKINKTSPKRYGLVLIKEYEQSDIFKIEQIVKDISDIKKRAKRVEYIADNYIAHMGKKVLTKQIKEETSEIEAVLKYLKEKAKYYNKVLFKTNFETNRIPDEPKIDGRSTWYEIFKTPWIEEK